MSTLEVKELSHPAGQVIKIASGKTLDLKSQGTTTLPTGSVLQVVQELDTGNFSTTSSTYVDTNLSASITPISTTSKILVLVSQTGFTGSSMNTTFNLCRGSTVITEAYSQSNTSGYKFAGNFINYLDSPSTTSAVTYKTQIKVTASTFYINWSNAGRSTITLMEIAQ